MIVGAGEEPFESQNARHSWLGIRVVSIDAQSSPRSLATNSDLNGCHTDASDTTRG